MAVEEAQEWAVEGVKAFQAIAARAERAVGSSRPPFAAMADRRSTVRAKCPACPIQVIITHPAAVGPAARATVSQKVAIAATFA